MAKKPAIGRKVIQADPDCDKCKGKGWVTESTGWPIECRCVFALLTGIKQPKPAAANGKPK